LSYRPAGGRKSGANGADTPYNEGSRIAIKRTVNHANEALSNKEIRANGRKNHEPSG
jgi:hypothetical protein